MYGYATDMCDATDIWQGMPYKYIVSVDSKGFDEASDEMLRALGRLTWATEKAVTDPGDEFLPPNELLTLGYFDEMKIGVWTYPE